MIPTANNPLPNLPRAPDGSFLAPGALFTDISLIPGAGLGLFAGAGESAAS